LLPDDWSSPEGRIIVAARKELTEHVGDNPNRVESAPPGVDPFTYLAYVISRLVNLWPTPGSKSLLPWN
jgi:hypothetical protein